MKILFEAELVAAAICFPVQRTYSRFKVLLKFLKKIKSHKIELRKDFFDFLVAA
jgi:hypothetical protein